MTKTPKTIPTASRRELRILMRGAYDVQKVRIETGNRVVANFKAELGQQPGTPEQGLSKEAKELLEVLRLSWQRITDGIAGPDATIKKPGLFQGDQVISTFTEYCLVANYLELVTAENQHFNRLEAMLPSFAIYRDYLKDVKGVGRAMAAVLISEFDITRAEYPSTMWAYAGLDVAGDGRGRSRRKEHLIKRVYTAKDGTEKERDSITFNPLLKTKLMGVLGPSFLRSGSPVRKYYDDYKHRLEHRPDLKDERKGRIHMMAVRYMVKQFLRDLYVEWRVMEGLPVAPTYAEAKLGIEHGKAADMFKTPKTVQRAAVAEPPTQGKRPKKRAA